MKKNVLPVLSAVAAVMLFSGARRCAADPGPGWDRAVAAVASGDFAKAVSDAAAAGHPRLFADKAAFDALASERGRDTLKALALSRVCERAEFLLGEKTLERKKKGKRLLHVCREALYRVSVLAMAYRVSGDRRFFDRCTAEMDAVCAFSDWNPSHFLDVGELSLAVSIGYDWLYDDLSPEKRAQILDALYRKSVLAGFAGGWWTKAFNNWGQVCRAGLIASSLVLADDPARRADCERLLRESVLALPVSMKAMAPDGCYPEGPGYWHYGVSFNVFAIAALESACGTDFGLSALPGFLETAEYPNSVTGPSGMTVGFSDGTSARGAYATLWWFARRLNRPDLLTGREISVWESRPRKGQKGWLPPVEIFWMDSRKKGEVFPYRAPKAWVPRGEMPMAVLRSGTDKSGAFAGIKGGSPSLPHGHMDGGNFVLDMDGVRWVHELPCENYTRIEATKKIDLWNLRQESSRWSLFRLNTFGHNVPQIDGAQQRVSGKAEFTDVRKDVPAVTLDLTSLYPAASKAVRSYSLSPDGKTFEVRDTFEGLRPGARIYWKFLTEAKAGPDGDTVVLRQSGKTLRVTKSGSPASSWEAGEAKGTSPYDTPNSRHSLVSFTAEPDAAGKASFTVRFSSTADVMVR